MAAFLASKASMAGLSAKPVHRARVASARAAPARLASRRGPLQVSAKKTEGGPIVAIAGVTGAVGQEFLTVLSQRDFPYGEMKMLSSARSAGKKFEWEGETYTIEELTEESLEGVDIALFSAGGSISKKFGPVCMEKGVIMVDNSSAFRMTEGVPLVIPEVNPEAMAHVRWGKGKGQKGAIIANPNCSTIIALMAVTPIHKKATVKRMVVSTYQAASGAGAAAMAELETQMREVLDGKPPTTTIFGRQYAFNLFSHNSGVDLATGYNEEELKLVKETAKIWNTKDVAITATCVRVPTMRAHAESINLELVDELSEADAKEILSKAPGITIVDDRVKNDFPTPLGVSNKDNVHVGRIRQDISQKGQRGIELFVCGDQIRKGAAQNAVQIAEALL
mmetsp:Transcript_1749/g.3012  ORF Transcript_1749/g.3012 Transcript_1749/m.3012 type:complete len:393 (-) Transcript_1749:254-1432(-)|eukprot:CAMPEP_0198212546 /NCGR_PEP_ID=MMETSP1445-20131203/26562_1 /TAXON_ID=36898 /ORGANISM="Pyramimonas sp., Strain CCMP2087" /LENGTH=392 /DNA_ID=CAMNT_0043887013 /DNA_START=108 /DNA_END=1286 /DNA_ORIENTATION=+